MLRHAADIHDEDELATAGCCRLWEACYGASLGSLAAESCLRPARRLPGRKTWHARMLDPCQKHVGPQCSPYSRWSGSCWLHWTDAKLAGTDVAWKTWDARMPIPCQKHVGPTAPHDQDGSGSCLLPWTDAKPGRELPNMAAGALLSLTMGLLKRT